MATSSVSNTNAINALGAGSGMDVKALATNLVEAERAPRKEVIDKKIAKSEARISGYAVVASALTQFKTSFEALNNKSDFSAVAVTSSQTGAFYVSATSSASVGNHSVSITALAAPQRSISTGYTAGASINAGAAFDLTLDGAAFGNVAQTIAISSANASPSGVVEAINAAGLGVTAALIATDSGNQIVITGKTGTANAYSVAGGGMSFSTTAGADARLTVDGLNLTRSSNEVNDAIPGVTINFSSLTTTPASVNLARDTSPVKASVAAMVAAYNEVNTILTQAASKGSKVSGYGASLVGDNTVQTLQSQLRSIVLGTSATARNGISALRDIGVSIDSKGVLNLDNTKLDTVLATKYADAVAMLSAGVDTEFVASTETNANVAGVAGVAINTLSTMLLSTGPLLSQSKNATSMIDSYKKELEKLELRMTALLQNYTKQFGAMETVVGQTNALRTSLTGTFDGMMATYTK